MNNGTAGVIGFIVGAAAGAGAGYYIARKYFTSNAIDIANQIIEMRIADGDLKVVTEEDSEEEEDDDKSDPNPTHATISSLTKDYQTSSPDELDYKAYYNKKDPGEIMAEREHPMDDGEYPPDMTEEEIAAEEGERLSDEREGDIILHKDKPYQITPDQYAEENNHYDKETLYGYSDGVIAHENDEMVDDIAMLIGDIDQMRKTFDGNETVYVRNDRFGTDYEVIFVETTYQETVDGVRTPDWAD